MESTTSTLTAFFDLFGLPPELRLLIFECVRDTDLCEMRLCSRQLFRESNMEFEERFLDKIKLLSKMAKVQQLHNILRLPIVAQSTPKVRELHVSLPTMNDLTMTNGFLDDWLPSKRSARRLLDAIPDLREFTLIDPGAAEEFQYRIQDEIFVENQAIPDVFLSALGSMNPEASNLTRLTLEGIYFDGLDLIGVLYTHSRNLRKVELMSCSLNRIQDQPVTWDLILYVLHTLNLDELFLACLYDASDEEALVLHGRSLSDQTIDNWSSRNPRHRAPPIDPYGTRYHFSDYEDVDVNGSCAIFSRVEVDLRHSWVKKGLEILLGKPNHNHVLYYDPRKFEGILRR